MKIGHQILFRRGSKPKIGRRYNTTENKLYKMASKRDKKIARMKKIGGAFSECSPEVVRRSDRSATLRIA